MLTQIVKLDDTCYMKTILWNYSNQLQWNLRVYHKKEQMLNVVYDILKYIRWTEASEIFFNVYPEIQSNLNMENRVSGFF